MRSLLGLSLGVGRLHNIEALIRKSCLSDVEQKLLGYLVGCERTDGSGFSVPNEVLSEELGWLCTKKTERYIRRLKQHGVISCSYKGTGRGRGRQRYISINYSAIEKVASARDRSS